MMSLSRPTHAGSNTLHRDCEGIAQHLNVRLVIEIQVKIIVKLSVMGQLESRRERQCGN
jgi:hypothetical protein